MHIGLIGASPGLMAWRPSDLKAKPSLLLSCLWEYPCDPHKETSSRYLSEPTFSC